MFYHNNLESGYEDLDGQNVSVNWSCERATLAVLVLLEGGSDRSKGKVVDQGSTLSLSSTPHPPISYGSL